jgi:hypothetical protein
MKLPKLAIEGVNADINRFVSAQASKSGFEVVPCWPEQAYTLAHDQSVVLIWVTTQAAPQRIVESAEYLAPTKHDLRNLYANAVLFATESLGERLLQVDRFLAEIKSGAICGVNNGQHWRGFTIRPVNYDIILPSWNNRVPA